MIVTLIFFQSCKIWLKHAKFLLDEGFNSFIVSAPIWCLINVQRKKAEEEYKKKEDLRNKKEIEERRKTELESERRGIFVILNVLGILSFAIDGQEWLVQILVQNQ